MEIPVAAPKALLADKGYDGDRFRESLLIQGILPIIPPLSNRKVPERPDYRRYRDGNRVERIFGKLKQQCRIATRYDKTVLSFESFLNLAAARLWLKSFVNTALDLPGDSRPNSGRPMTLPGQMLERQLLSVADIQPPHTQCRQVPVSANAGD